MAQLNFRVQNALAGTFRAMDEADAAAATVGGWKVGKSAAGLSSELTVGVESTGFSSQSTSPKPNGLITGASPNAWRSVNQYTGDFAATAWSIKVAVRSVSTAYSGTGRARVRVFASVNADGSSARELTAATQVGTTVGPGSTSADVVSTVTWTPAAVMHLSGEYIFVAIAWEIVTASGSNNADADLRTGSSGTTTGSNILTSDFTAPVAKSGSDVNGTTTESATVTPAKSTQQARLALSAPAFLPDTAGVLNLLVRARKHNAGDSGDLFVELWEGGTQRFSGSILGLTTSFATTTFDLSSLLGTITNWNSLEVRLRGWANASGANLTPDVSFIELDSTPSSTANSTQVSGSDANGTTTEASALHAALGSSDQSGTPSETSALVVTVVATDSNGSTTEASKISLAGAADTNGVSTEAASARASLSGSEASAVAVEASAIRVVAQPSETNGSTTEIATPVAALTASDNNGATAETAVVSVPTAGSDANGPTTEVSSLIAGVNASEVNGSPVEASSIAASVVAAEANVSVVETATVTVRYTVSEANAIAVEASVLSGQLSASESNSTATEVGSTGIGAQTVTGSDVNGPTIETASVRVQLTATEQGGVAEVALLVARLAAAEVNGSTTELVTLLYRIAVSETAGATEAALIGINPTVSETNGVTGEAAALRVALLALEAAIPDEESELVVVLPVAADTGFGTDTATIHVGQTYPTIETGRVAGTEVGRGMVMRPGSGKVARGQRGRIG